MRDNVRREEQFVCVVVKGDIVWACFLVAEQESEGPNEDSDVKLKRAESPSNVRREIGLPCGSRGWVEVARRAKEANHDVRVDSTDDLVIDRMKLEFRLVTTGHGARGGSRSELVRGTS